MKTSPWFAPVAPRAPQDDMNASTAGSAWTIAMIFFWCCASELKPIPSCASVNPIACPVS